MASNPLDDRYKRYKAGTAQLVNWLADTARHCRDVTDILPSLRAAKNASKQAKKNKKRNDADDSQMQVKVSAASLLQLAEIVANANVPIPKGIITVAQDVIEGRKTCSTFYEALSVPENSSVGEQNKSHRHFIGILEQILGVLLKAFNARPPSKSLGKTQQEKSDEDGNGLGNIFSCLQVEEPSTTPLGSAPTPRLTVVSSNITFELETSEEETTFAVWCLLTDLYDIRAAIGEMWRDHKAGYISFAAAAITTDVGFSIVKRTEADFLKNFPEFFIFTNLLCWLKLNIIMVNDSVVVFPKQTEQTGRLLQVAGPKSTFTANIIAELVTPRGVIIMRSFRDTMAAKQNKTDIKLHEKHEQYFKCHPFATAMLETLPEIELIAKRIRSIDLDEMMVLEHFISGLLHLYESPKDLPTWLVFASEVYMDIYDILGPNFKNGHRILLTRGMESLKSLQAWFDRCERSDTSQAADYIEDGPLGDEIGIRKLMSDWFADDRKNQRKTKPGVGLLINEPYHFMRTYPLVAGVNVYTLGMRTHYAGIEVLNDARVVLCTAYLYKACVSSGALTRSWPDMEFIIETHSKMRPFIWESEQGVSAMARHLGMALGVKRTDFDKAQRPKLPSTDQIQRLAKRVERDFPLLTVYNKQPRDRLDVDAGMFEAATLCFMQQQKSRAANGGRSEVSKQWQKVGKLTPQQLVVGFKDAFIDFEPDLNSDYIRFTLQCFDLLRDVLNQCAPVFTYQAPEAAPGWNQRPQELVYAILWDAADSANNAKCGPSQALLRAGRCLQEYVAEHGSTFSKQAFEKASGHTPGTAVTEPTRREDNDVSESFGLPAEMLSFAKRFNIPIPGMPSKPTFCATEAEMVQRFEASKAFGAALSGNLSLDEENEALEKFDKASRVAIDKMHPIEQTIMTRQYIDLVAELAHRYGYENVRQHVEVLVKTYSPFHREYIIERMASVPGVAKEKLEAIKSSFQPRIND